MNQAVSPSLQKDIVLKERLQKLATRLVKGFRQCPSERRLQILGLPTLVHLRWRADLVLVYNIRHGSVNIPIDGFFERSANPNLRGHRCKLRHQMSHLARRKFSFHVMVFGTPCLFPKTLGIFNIVFLMPVYNCIGYKCLFVVIWRAGTCV